MKVRIEKDELGIKEIPAEAYYGIQTQRSKENFDIVQKPISRNMIKALATIKKATARANCDAGLIDKKVSDAIALACDEIINGRLHGINIFLRSFFIKTLLNRFNLLVLRLLKFTQ